MILIIVFLLFFLLDDKEYYFLYVSLYLSQSQVLQPHSFLHIYPRKINIWIHFFKLFLAKFTCTWTIQQLLDIWVHRVHLIILNLWLILFPLSWYCGISSLFGLQIGIVVIIDLVNYWSIYATLIEIQVNITLIRS